MAIRLMGKAGFAHLQQGGQKLQIYVKKDAVGDRGFELYKLLDLGDHIGVSGYLFRTRTGELTVHVEEITFLSKDLLPLPEKFHGLTDVELRYRQRYVDLVVNPEFTMLEFYQAYTDYQGVMDLTQELITEAAKDVTGGTKAKWGDVEIDWANWQRLTMRVAIIHYWPESAGAKPAMSDFASHDG